MTLKQHLQHGGRDIGEVLRQSLEVGRLDVVEGDHQHPIRVGLPKPGLNLLRGPGQGRDPRMLLNSVHGLSPWVMRVIQQ
jgi:hypothetical protein